MHVGPMWSCMPFIASLFLFAITRIPCIEAHALRSSKKINKTNSSSAHSLKRDSSWPFVEAGHPLPWIQPAVKKPTEGRITIDDAKAPSWWGFPHYPGPPKSWRQLEYDQGMLGRACEATKVTQHCGSDWVCRHGFCSECHTSKECSEKFKCQMSQESGHKVCIPRDLRTQWHWGEVVGTVLIVFTAMVSAAAGMGGGGVYVPLLLLLLGLSTKEAVPLSQAMIFGGSVVNVIMFCGERHPKYPQRPKIDYDVVMMLNPGLAAGVTLGVICHLVSPQWLIVTILVITLVQALQKSLTKGIASWKKESAALAAAQAASGGSNGGGDGAAGSGAKLQVRLADFQSARQIARTQQKQMMLIGGCWLTFLALNVLKAPACSMLYWAQKAFMMVVCAGFTYMGANTIRERAQSAGSDAEGMLEWTPRTMWLYPAFAAVAGFLGGFLGIGGGIIMGPLLLELNMIPEASQATTAMFVFLSSSLAAFQFVLLGATMPQYVLWFTSWVTAATFVGQTGVDYLLQKYKRSSLIVLSIAAIIAGSLVMMSFTGAMDIYGDIMRGAYMGFIPHKLCGA